MALRLSLATHNLKRYGVIVDGISSDGARNRLWGVNGK